MSSDSQEEYSMEEPSSEVHANHSSVQTGVDKKLADSDLKQNVSEYQSKERLIIIHMYHCFEYLNIGDSTG